MKYILECPRCKNILEWTRQSMPDGPGNCHCGAYASWRVLKDKPPECPICGDYHSKWINCEDDNMEPQLRDWGDL